MHPLVQLDRQVQQGQAVVQDLKGEQDLQGLAVQQDLVDQLVRQGLKGLVEQDRQGRQDPLDQVVGLVQTLMHKLIV